jgi:UDP-N-acetyl-D-mannosaminuronate dehydrogenase
MPEYVVERITGLLNRKTSQALNKTNIVVLGVAYKRDIKDLRESPALDVIKLLEDKGAKIAYNDPYVPSFRWKGGVVKSVKLTPTLLKKAALVVILTDHTDYNYQWVVDHARLVFDSRIATKSKCCNSFIHIELSDDSRPPVGYFFAVHRVKDGHQCADMTSDGPENDIPPHRRPEGSAPD